MRRRTLVVDFPYLNNGDSSSYAVARGGCQAYAPNGPFGVGVGFWCRAAWGPPAGVVCCPRAPAPVLTSDVTCLGGVQGRFMGDAEGLVDALTAACELQTVTKPEIKVCGKPVGCQGPGLAS